MGQNSVLNKLMEREIKYFINRKIKRNNQAKGLLLAFRITAEDGKDYILFGHSLCDNKDRFSHESAYKLAISRGIKRFKHDTYDVPHSIKKDFDNMVGRVINYFKYFEQADDTVTFPTWFNKLIDKEIAEEAINATSK